MKLNYILPVFVIAALSATAQARDPNSLKVEADHATLRAAHHQLEIDVRQLRIDQRAGRSATARDDAQRIETDHGRLAEEEAFLHTDLVAARKARVAREVRWRRLHGTVSAER